MLDTERLILQKMRKALDELRAAYKKLLYFGPLGKTPKRRTPERYRLAVVHQQLQLLSPVFRALRAVLEPNQQAVGETMRNQLLHYDKQVSKLRAQLVTTLELYPKTGLDVLLPDMLDLELPLLADPSRREFLPAKTLRKMGDEVRAQLQLEAAQRQEKARDQDQAYRDFMKTLTPEQRALAQRFARNGVATLHARDL